MTADQDCTWTMERAGWVAMADELRRQAHLVAGERDAWKARAAQLQEQLTAATCGAWKRDIYHAIDRIYCDWRRQAIGDQERDARRVLEQLGEELDRVPF